MLRFFGAIQGGQRSDWGLNNKGGYRLSPARDGGWTCGSFRYDDSALHSGDHLCDSKSRRKTGRSAGQSGRRDWRSGYRVARRARLRSLVASRCGSRRRIKPVGASRLRVQRPIAHPQERRWDSAALKRYAIAQPRSQRARVAGQAVGNDRPLPE